MVSHAEPFKSARGKYSIAPPVEWKVDTSRFMGSDVLFAAPPHNGFASNIVVIVAPSGGRDIESAPRQVPAMMKQMLKRGEILSHGFTTLGGQRAYFLEARHDVGTPARRVRLRSVTSIHGENIVAFTASALDKDYARFAPIFNQTIDTVKWTK
jgi:hypothetical protein